LKKVLWSVIEYFGRQPGSNPIGIVESDSKSKYVEELSRYLQCDNQNGLPTQQSLDAAVASLVNITLSIDQKVKFKHPLKTGTMSAATETPWSYVESAEAVKKLSKDELLNIFFKLDVNRKFSL
jgi:CCR4-NOT transcriptional regulation complex NOT5 subunit